jgi:hypothetical protein
MSLSNLKEDKELDSELESRLVVLLQTKVVCI